MSTNPISHSTRNLYQSLPKSKMPSFDSYNAKTTSISYPWPQDVNGVERIALSAQGDLQRVLSAFFARPIVIALVYSTTTRQLTPSSPPEIIIQPTPSIIESTSPSQPIIQTRQVHLQCAGKIVCTATSTVRITSPEVAHLFLQEKYAIGQMFRRLEKVPAFELLSVGLGAVKEKGQQQLSLSYTPNTPGYSEANQLWRKYTLTIPNFECEILEVFPSRDMFVSGEAWLTGTISTKGIDHGDESARDCVALTGMQTGLQSNFNASIIFYQSLSLLLGLGFMLMLAFEVVVYHNRRVIC